MCRQAFCVVVPQVILCPLLLVLALCGCRAGSHVSEDRVETLGRFFPGEVQVRPLSSEEPPRNGAGPDVVEITDLSGETLGYVVELEVVSRSGPFGVLVALDATRCVRDVRILRYTARRGRGVLSRQFTSQFEGKCPQDPITIGTDIHAVTGATLSAKAVAGGVRRAIELINEALEN